MKYMFKKRVKTKQALENKGCKFGGVAFQFVGSYHEVVVCFACRRSWDCWGSLIIIIKKSRVMCLCRYFVG
jgi:hypothetical protein